VTGPPIAFLTPVVPAASGNGLAMRAALLLEGLAAAGPVQVIVVPVFHSSVAASRLEPSEVVRSHAAGFSVVPLEDAPDALADAVARLTTAAGRTRATTLSPLPTLARTATIAAGDHVARMTAHAAAIVVLRLYLAPFLDRVLDQPRRPRLVLDVDDVESTTRHRLGETEEAQAFERVEAHYLPVMDHVLTCSTGDADALVGRYSLDRARVTAVRNAVSPPAGRCEPAPAHDLLFVSNLSYRPNVLGARWLCRRVLTHAALARATAALVGSGPTAEIRALARPGRVTVAADVASVGPWYAASRVAVVPVPPAGGTRIKIIEAMAHRRPIVSTTAGAEGLDLGPTTSVVIADGAEAFAHACRHLLDDPAESAARAAAGWDWVEAHATIGVVAPRITSVLDRLLG